MEEKTKDFFEELKKRRAVIVKEWEDAGLLDGLKGSAKSNMAELFQGQKEFIINESENKPCENFDEVVLPIIRRVFAKLAIGFDPVYGMLQYQIDDNRIMF
jgi:hypothetical protein